MPQLSDPETSQLKALLTRNTSHSPQKPSSSCPFRIGQRTISYVTPEMMAKLRESRTVVENGVAKVMPKEMDHEFSMERGLDLVVLPVNEAGGDKGRLMIDGKKEKLKKWNGKEDVQMGFKLVGRRKRRRARDSSDRSGGVATKQRVSTAPNRRLSSMDVVSHVSGGMEDRAESANVTADAQSESNGKLTALTATTNVMKQLPQQQRTVIHNNHNVTVPNLTVTSNTLKEPSNAIQSVSPLRTGSRSSSRLTNYANGGAPTNSTTIFPSNKPSSTRIRNNPTTKRQMYDDRPKSKYYTTHSPPKKLFNRNYFQQMDAPLPPTADEQEQKSTAASIVMRHHRKVSTMLDVPLEDASARSIQLSSGSSWDATNNLPTQRQSAQRPLTAPKMRPSASKTVQRRKRKTFHASDNNKNEIQPISIPQRTMATTGNRTSRSKAKSVTPYSPTTVKTFSNGADDFSARHHHYNSDDQSTTINGKRTNLLTGTRDADAKPADALNKFTSRISVNLTIKEPEAPSMSPSSPRQPTKLSAMIPPVRRRHSSAFTNHRLTKSSASLTNSPLHNSFGRQRSNSDKSPTDGTSSMEHRYTMRRHHHHHHHKSASTTSDASQKIQVKIRNAPRGVTLPSPLVSP
uniref:Uncharacterized protein n=1 Tax=Percolomonas cosmopolitus TaxID=63605 RepID=A0A7S1PHK0_9EUKA|mmetsp:Transcript_5715/g.21619  ORF Transcript_5715/g.21619 Transcript_5715/m.21619 type:complete len:630 (+) Transcript_5715:374-2263(+)|eukprot:CAMPEP_0117450452 /NCGR_PEP_ID=MMETSP0759-20121206/8475_1 /TAXON_ID=63605 /ORGANISM="Percolomonas cosmopolitus, Strain WS" /LENGTH=629 /DNA_ID=CAMNT_0005242973 /DNA_START=367 /DNA_END=2256 /DNA_ORIENTATION=-